MVAWRPSVGPRPVATCHTMHKSTSRRDNQGVQSLTFLYSWYPFEVSFEVLLLEAMSWVAALPTTDACQYASLSLHWACITDKSLTRRQLSALRGSAALKHENAERTAPLSPEKACGQSAGSRAALLLCMKPRKRRPCAIQHMRGWATKLRSEFFSSSTRLTSAIHPKPST